MKQEIILVKNSSYARYEELLVKRDNLRKAAFLLERQYVKTFGDRILKIFKVEIECIRKKKIISFYQAALNHGKTVDQNKLKKYLDAEMAGYQAELLDMIKDNEASKNSRSITDIAHLNIRKIYRKLAKLLHPDINSKTSEIDELRGLWERITIAYKCNALKELEELEILVLSALESLGDNSLLMDIPNIDEKISAVETEIDKIKNTDPYQYKYLLNDTDAVEEQNHYLDDEYDSFKEYESQLDEIIIELIGNGVTVLWKMN